MVRDLAADRGPGVLQSIALGGHHVQQLTAARHQGLELLQGRIRHRPRRGMYSFRKEREELRIETIGFGELPRRFGEVADLARVRHHHREAGDSQGGDERGFVSTRGFEDDERRRQGTHAVDGGGDA